MILNILPSTSGSAIRPKQDIPFSEKTDQWAVANAKYILSYHQNGESGIPNTFKDKVQELRNYSAGRQNPEKYKKVLIGENTTPTIPTGSSDQNTTVAANEGWMNVDFNNIFSPAPKYIYNLLGKFEEVGSSIGVNAIDTFSTKKKEQQKASLMVLNKFKDSIPPDAPMPEGLEGKKIPNTKEELDLYESIGGLKQPFEANMESILKYTDELSDMPQIKRKCLIDAIEIGVLSTMDVLDEQQQKVAIEYLDPADVIIEYSRSTDFKNSRFAAVPKLYTISELRVMTSMTEDELIEVAGKWKSQYGNPSEVRDGYNEVSQTWNYDNYKIPVLHAYWKSVDVKKDVGEGMIEISKDKVRPNELKKGKIVKKGEKYFKPIKNAEIEKERIRTIYEYQWIVDTEKGFNFRKLRNIPFDYSAKDALLPIHVYKLPGKSIMERMKPILDDIQLTYLRLQNVRAKAPPPGLQIEIGSLTNLTFGGKKWRPLDLLKLYSHTGHMLYKATTAEGGYMSGGSMPSPIQELKGGYGTAITDAIRDFEISFQHLADITGIDRVSSISGGSNPETSAAEVKIASASTSDAIQPLYIAWEAIRVQASKNVALRAESICNTVKDKSKGYFNVIGEKGVKAIKSIGYKYPIEWGIVFDPLPTAEDKMLLKDAAMKAFAQGHIEMSDYMFIMDGIIKAYSLKNVRNYLILKEQEGRQRQQEMADANTQALAQKELAVVQGKTQSELALIDAKTQGEILVNQSKFTNELQLAREQTRLDIIKKFAETEIESEREALQQLLDKIDLEVALGNDTQQPIAPQEPMQPESQPELGGEMGGVEGGAMPPEQMPPIQ